MHKDLFIEGRHVDLVGLSEDLAISSRWYAWFNDPDVTVHLQKHHFPNSPTQQLEFYRNHIEGRRDRLQLGVVPHSLSDLIGVISLNNIDYINRRAEISLVIGEPGFRNMENSLDAMSLLIAHAFNALNLRRIYGGTIAQEWAMLLIRSLGFQQEGVFRSDVYKDGKYRDVYFVGLMKDEFRGTQNPSAMPN